MEAQRSALDVLAQNLALVQTADAAHPVHTLVPQFVSGPQGDDFAASLASLDVSDRDDDAADADDAAGAFGSVDEASFGPDSLDASDSLPGQIRFAGVRPSSVAVSGVDAVSEMGGVLGAQRSFEAGASVFDTGKRLIERLRTWGERWRPNRGHEPGSELAEHARPHAGPRRVPRRRASRNGPDHFHAARG